MTKLRSLPLLLLACCAGCGSASPRPFLARQPEVATAPRPGAANLGGAPRIGAPGGSGAGSRSVVPAQSGNETVGGLPAGSGKSGRRG